MKSIQIFALFLLVFLAACKKDQDGTDPQPAAKRLMEMNNLTLPTDYVKMKYNAAGQIVRFDSEEDQYTVTYSGSTVHIVEFRPAENKTVWDFTGQLDDKGRLVSSTGFAAYIGAPQPETQTFKYNNDGYLIEKVLDRNNGQQVWTYKYTYTNGNLTRLDALLNGTPYYGGVYEYGTTADLLKLNWDRFDIINTFTGKTNKNLAVKYTGLNEKGDFSWSVDFTYTLDKDGYPVKQESSYSSGKKYTYEYKY